MSALADLRLSSFWIMAALAVALTPMGCGAPNPGSALSSVDQSLAVPPWLAYYDYQPADLDAVAASARTNGFRPISVSAWGTPEAPRLAATFVRRSGPDWTLSHGVGNSSWQTTFDLAVIFGLKPVALSFDGDSGNPVWAAIFVATTTGIPLTRNGLVSGSNTNSSTIQYWLQFAHNNGLIPSTLSIYGTAASPAYALVLEPNSTNVNWSVGDSSDVNQSAADYQAHWDAMVPAGNQVRAVDLNGDNRYIALFRDDSVGPLVGFHNMTRAEMDNAYATQTAAGLFPISIQGGGVDGSTVRYAALFAQSDQPLPITVHSAGTNRSFDIAIPAVDRAVTSFMKAHDVRQASLAVLSGRKLAYARGYTRGEPGAARVHPGWTFRLASVSKVVTAMEIMKLVDEGQIALSDTVQGILNLYTYWGMGPPALFDTITVQNLLQHSYPTLSPNCLLRDADVSQTAATALGMSLPVTRYGAILNALSDPLLVTRPPNPGDGCYSNFGYVLLGQIIEARRGLPLLTAIQQDLFAPLSITRAQVAVSDVLAQPAREARYYALNLATTGNVNVPGSPLAEVPYGGDNFDVMEAAGGLSMAAVDVARLLSALDFEKKNPIYSHNVSAMTVATILGDQLGFDQTFTDAFGKTRYVKGGEISGLQSTASFSQHGMSYVLVWDRDGLDSFTGADNWWPSWGTLETALHNAHLSVRRDLFPAYGMPKL